MKSMSNGFVIPRSFVFVSRCSMYVLSTKFHWTISSNGSLFPAACNVDFHISDI